jgi:hypothetical protein
MGFRGWGVSATNPHGHDFSKSDSIKRRDRSAFEIFSEFSGNSAIGFSVATIQLLLVASDFPKLTFYGSQFWHRPCADVFVRGHRVTASHMARVHRWLKQFVAPHTGSRTHS